MLDQNSQLKKFYQTNMVIKVAFGSCLVEKSEFPPNMVAGCV